MFDFGQKCAAVALLVLTPLAASAQAPDTVTPRTAWGDPDLQGVFDYATITPMQRPQQYADREYLTEEEAATLEQGAEARDQGAAEAPARRAQAGENVGAYNNFWMDWGTKVVEGRRTSLIVDPPNGRFPALTEAGAAEAKLRKGFGAIMPADDHLEMGYGDRCLAVHGLPFIPLPYNSTVQFFQTPDHVASTARATASGGSFHWIRTMHRTVSVSGWAIRVATGMATRWWWRPRTFRICCSRSGPGSGYAGWKNASRVRVTA